MNNNEAIEKIDLMKYIDMFYRSFLHLKKLVILVFILVVGLFEVKEIFFFQTTYSSKAAFTVAVDGKESASSDDKSQAEFDSALNAALTGPSMQELIRNELKLSAIPGSIRMHTIPDTSIYELQVITDDAKLSYEIISSILSNYGVVMQYSMSDVSLSVIDTPFLAKAPDATPNYIKVFIKACILSIMINFVLILMYSLFRKTIINSKDTEQYLNLKTLATVPLLKSKNKQNYSLLLSNSSVQYGIKKAFQDLRFCIERESDQNGSNVFLITSTMPNEGKTMTSINTALSLAENGNRVVLVDLDLRNPSIFKKIAKQRSVFNILDYLKYNESIEDILNPYEDTSLQIIYGVNAISNAPELLESEKLKVLIQRLKKEFDYVILDLPPLHLIQDALIVSEYVDSAIVVVKQDYVNTGLILDELEELNTAVPSILGVVINQAKQSVFDEESITYGYGYGYGYGKKYGK